MKRRPSKKAKSAPLSDRQRATFRDEAFTKACEHLKEAEIIANSNVPRSSVHAAYYAVYHAATAILLSKRGDMGLTAMPSNHAEIRHRFSALVQRTGAERPGEIHDLNDAGTILIERYAARQEGDYGAAPFTSDDGKQAVVRARRFFEIARKLFGLNREDFV